MLVTSDPQHCELLAAPPIRSLHHILGQYAAALTPALAAAGIHTLRLASGETSFYCRRPGRRAILDASALPPSGRVRQEGQAQPGGYVAELVWPVEDDKSFSNSHPFFRLTIERSH
jgi:hypothetical protein